MQLRQEIAKDAQKNELFELIEFVVTHAGSTAGGAGVGQSSSVFGVNVAKVREVIRLPQIVPCLTLSPEVVGVFNLRGEPIPAIHLAKAIGFSDEQIQPCDQVIVTEFAQRRAGFIIAGTRRIRRVPQDQILPPSSSTFANITGMLLLEDSQFLFMLDFEEILLDIEARHSGSRSSANHRGGVSLAERKRRLRALVVDDSPMTRRVVVEMLEDLGLDIVECGDGEEAWQVLLELGTQQGVERVDVLITDIEMPRLDGYALVERVRSSGRFPELPIVVHSSLTGLVNRERALEVGANSYVNKLNRREMIQALRSALNLELADNCEEAS